MLVQSLATTALFRLLRSVFIVLQRVCWQLNGTVRKLREARLPENYERSAQVLDVVLRHRFCPLQEIAANDFLCTHNRFEHPQYIIDNDNISLMVIDEHDAVFCETEEKGGLSMRRCVTKQHTKLEGNYSLESTDPRESEIRAHLRP